MQDKTELIKEKLTPIFKDAKLRSLGRTIRFNAEEINDNQLTELAIISSRGCCEIKVKRSGTGLLIVVNV